MSQINDTYVIDLTSDLLFEMHGFVRFILTLYCNNVIEFLLGNESNLQPLLKDVYWVNFAHV